MDQPVATLFARIYALESEMVTLERVVDELVTLCGVMNRRYAVEQGGAEATAIGINADLAKIHRELHDLTTGWQSQRDLD